MKIYPRLSFWFLLLSLVFPYQIPAIAAESDTLTFIKGADVSFIPQIEDLGGIFKENGIETDPLTVFKNHDFNYIRLKIWHTPDEDYNNLAKILLMAQRIKAADMKFLLNFHYSDTWADPGKQYKPAAWQSLTFAALKDSVYQYTHDVIKALNDQGTLPDMVQIGNEITAGMLWNDGRVGGSYDTDTQWNQFSELLKAGIRGVRESCEQGDSVKIMIHIDRGGNNTASRWFFDNLFSKGVDFDIIGLSFYPWWHGTLTNLRNNLNDLATRYGKDLIVAETAYPWTLEWADTVDNIVGSSDDLLAGYPATVTGQKNYLRDIMAIIKDVPNEKGCGLFYWAPEYISVDPIGSPWENNTLFDFNGNVLESIDIFKNKEPAPDSVIVTVQLNTATLMDTLGENHVAQIRGEIHGYSYNVLPDGRKLTWDAESELIMQNQGGDYWTISFPMYPGDTLFFKFWTGFSLSKPTFQRLGWEGPVQAYGLNDNHRVIIAGERDTTIAVQYFNSTGSTRAQYWQPFVPKSDTLAVYFRVNLGPAVSSGRFNPDSDGPVTVRGDATSSGNSLAWDESRLLLEQEEYSVNNESFWSGTVYIPKSALVSGNSLEYKFNIENGAGRGLEGGFNRSLIFTESLLQEKSDTTLHWVYFNTSNSGIAGTEAKRPTLFQLEQNYPNPFNDQTRITYRLAQSCNVSLDIFDIHGRYITTLVRTHQTTGLYNLTWNAGNAENLASGIYLIRLKTDYGETKCKTLLLK